MFWKVHESDPDALFLGFPARQHAREATGGTRTAVFLC